MDVVVLGSVNVDLLLRCERIPRTGETVFGTSFEYFTGGKGANQAVAAARAGATTRLCGGVGRDPGGNRAVAFLKANGVDVEELRVLDAQTGLAVIGTDVRGENSIMVIPGANRQARARLDRIEGPVIALAQMETPPEETKRLFRHVLDRGGITIFNPSPYGRRCPELLGLCSCLIMNGGEFGDLSGRAGPLDEAAMMDALASLSRGWGDVVVTRGAEGYIGRFGKETESRPGYDVEVVDSVGAGDCFAGVFAAALASGDDSATAAAAANAAAAISVTRSGSAAAMPRLDEILTFVASKGPDRTPKTRLARA